MLALSHSLARHNRGVIDIVRPYIPPERFLMNATPTKNSPVARLGEFIKLRLPGFGVAFILAIAAQFLSEHYGAPAMLMALLLGIAFHFLYEEGPCVPGIKFSEKAVLRFGVALLGARISADLVIALGIKPLLLVVGGVAATLFFGLLAAKLLKKNWCIGVLTGGSVAICGASAAMAISAVLPSKHHKEHDLVFTVLGVTLLSTLAMIFYPIIGGWLGLDDHALAIVLGGTIHDVAQVVGAGFSVSDEAGETATVVKLVRVIMLAPIVLGLSIVVRSSGDEAQTTKPPLLPEFVVAFLVLATLNSFGLIPEQIGDWLNTISRWALLTAIAAVGMKTSLKTMFDQGGSALALLASETVFLAIFILVGVMLLG